MERSPSHKTDITEAQQDLQTFLKEGGLSESPADLRSYIRFVDATLRRWQQQGAAGPSLWTASAVRRIPTLGDRFRPYDRGGRRLSSSRRLKTIIALAHRADAPHDPFG